MMKLIFAMLQTHLKANAKQPVDSRQGKLTDFEKSSVAGTPVNTAMIFKCTRDG
jgi:hypothetical protein